MTVSHKMSNVEVEDGVDKIFAQPLRAIFQYFAQSIDCVYMCNEQPSQATETPSVEMHAHPPRVVNCAIYSTLTRFTKFQVLKFAYYKHSNSANTLHQHLFFKGGYPVTLLPPPRRNPVGGKACSSTKGGLLRYILNTYSIHKVSSFNKHSNSANTLHQRIFF